VTRSVNPRSITDAERPWLADWTPGTQRVLIRALRGRGHPNNMAFGILGMITAKALGEPDGLSNDTRVRYRKALRQLADAGITPPGNRGNVVELADATPAPSAPGPRSARVGTAARAAEAPSLLSALAGVSLALVAAPIMVEPVNQAAELAQTPRSAAWSPGGWDVSEASRAA
jgi:hypothetical protein